MRLLRIRQMHHLSTDTENSNLLSAAEFNMERVINTYKNINYFHQ